MRQSCEIFASCMDHYKIIFLIYYLHIAQVQTSEESALKSFLEQTPPPLAVGCASGQAALEEEKGPR